jgi:SET domain-containing protein
MPSSTARNRVDSLRSSIAVARSASAIGVATRAIDMKSVHGANYRLIVKPSPIHGDGVFAAEDIPWGSKILEYGGAVINDAEADRRIRAGAGAVMELGDGKNIDGFDGGNGAALINHSRMRANCFLLREKGKVWLVAGVEGIKAGEELTYDYGSDYYPKGKRAEQSR